MRSRERLEILLILLLASSGVRAQDPGWPRQNVQTHSLVSVDAMQEFRVQTSSFATEFGRTPCGQISIVTRSASNEFHGTAFEHFRNDVLDANHWFSSRDHLPKPEERQNDFGGVFGGPILKDRTFFFFSYEGLRLRQPATQESVVPDTASRQQAPTTMQPYLNTYPIPNGPDLGGTAQFNGSYSNPSSLDAYSIRVDHAVNSKLSLFGRYNYSPSDFAQRGPLITGTGPVLSTSQSASSSIHTFAVGLNQVISPLIGNEIRANYRNERIASKFVPEKVRFRVKLEGQDKDWRELVNERHVQYTNLAPKTYRFLVKACSNSGVWNEEGAALAFTIPPMWYSTNWFLALCVAAFLAFLWALYQLRLHQLAGQFNMRLEPRVGERTRIARDLHDTLLQSFHGILLRMQILSNELPDGHTKEKLDTVIDEAEHAIVEGRDALQGLRASTVERNDLAAAIRTLGDELAAADSSSHRPEFSVQMEGAPRKLHPILRDEVYRIAGEAMRNAFRHAYAQRIEVEIRYDEWQLRVRVRDDGKGIDLKVLGDNGREGHFGLRGMRERAKLIGGKLTVWSELDSGTEVELIIPSARAYVTAPERRRSSLVEKLAGKLTGKDTGLKS